MSACAPPIISTLGSQDISNGQQRSGSPDHAECRLPVPLIAAAAEILEGLTFPADDLLPPGHTCASPLPASPPPPQPRDPRLFTSVFEAKNKSELWIATGAWTKARLRAKKALPDLTVYEGPHAAWRFQVPNPYAATLPISPTDENTQTCPSFSPGCKCTAGNAAYVPMYYSANERGSKYFEYAKNMAYIPSVLPRAPPLSRIWAEPPPELPPARQAPGPTNTALARGKSSVGDNDASASVPAGRESGPLVQAQHNHPVVYASQVERIENSLESGTLSSEYPLQNHPPPRHPATRQPPHGYPPQGFRAPGHPSPDPSPARHPAPGQLPQKFPAPPQQCFSRPDIPSPCQPPRGYSTSGYPAPIYPSAAPPDYYHWPDLLTPPQRLQGHPSPAYHLPSYPPPPQPGYPSPCPPIGYLGADYHSLCYASSGYRSSGYPASNYPSSGYRSQIPQFTAAPPSAPATSRPLDGATRRPSQQIKRALEDEDDDEESTQPSGNDQPKKKRKQGVQGVKESEKALIARYMKVEVDAKNGTESKWQNVADKLRTNHGIQRSGHSVKAWWSRQGRQEFGLDERKNPNGRKLVTSKQDPDERRKARERKKREATEGTGEQGGS
ncbi:MAG: hypothetical protein Q9184_003497 [Pyrenodesmia sp. 2 TL-2023]